MLWGSAGYDALARRFAPVHDELVGRLAPGPGLRWLDVATGTGEVALRAARAGADVTALDISPALLEQARRKAGDLAIRFDEGDAAALPYPDGSFRAASSCFGHIFAPDHAAVGRELARVVERGGRIVLTAWEPSAELRDLYAPYGPPPEGLDSFEWGREAHARDLLEPAFELAVEHGVWHLEDESGESAWRFWSRSAPPTKALLESLEPPRRAALARDAAALYERYRDGDRVRVPRQFLWIVGTRR